MLLNQPNLAVPNTYLETHEGSLSSFIDFASQRLQEQAEKKLKDSDHPADIESLILKEGWATLDNLSCHEHAERMGESACLFRYLISIANQKGEIETTYCKISKKMNVPIKTLRAWMGTLEQERYLTIKEKDSMLIQIMNFRLPGRELGTES